MGAPTNFFVARVAKIINGVFFFSFQVKRKYFYAVEKCWHLSYFFHAVSFSLLSMVRSQEATRLNDSGLFLITLSFSISQKKNSIQVPIKYLCHMTLVLHSTEFWKKNYSAASRLSFQNRTSARQQQDSLKYYLLAFTYKLESNLTFQKRLTISMWVLHKTI